MFWLLVLRGFSWSFTILNRIKLHFWSVTTRMLNLQFKDHQSHKGFALNYRIVANYALLLLLLFPDM